MRVPKLIMLIKLGVLWYSRDQNFALGLYVSSSEHHVGARGVGWGVIRRLGTKTHDWSTGAADGVYNAVYNTTCRYLDGIMH